MAIKVAHTTGNWSNAAIWGTGTNTEASVASATLTMSSTRYTAVFTAPNTTNACLGAIFHIYVMSVTVPFTLTCTLQEYDGVSAWVDKSSATVDSTDLTPYLLTSTLTSLFAQYFFKFATPYVYTTTTAGYYRFKIASSPTSAVTSLYRGSTTTQPVAVIVDDRTGVPASTDDVYIVGDKTGEIVVTIDGDVEVGSGTGSEGSPPSQDPATQKALTHGFNGTLTFGESASATLTIYGQHLVGNGGGFHAGTSGSPFPAAYTATVKYKSIAPSNTVSAGAAFYSWNQSVNKISFVGQTKTFKAMYVSGTGTTADPLIVDSDTGWVVGDRLGISGNAYNKQEDKYIKTKVATNTYILSDSVGGAESGLANAHYAADWVLNLSRNVIFTSEGSSDNIYGLMFTTSATAMYYKYVQFDGVGSGVTANRSTWHFNQGVRYSVSLEGCSFIHYAGSSSTSGYGVHIYNTNKSDNLFKDCIVYSVYAAYGVYGAYVLAYKGTFTNNYVMGGRYTGWYLGGNGATYDNFHVRNTSSAYTSSVTYAAIVFAGGSNVVLSNCTANASRSHGIVVAGGTNIVLKDCAFGTVYDNSTLGQIGVGTTGSYATAVFDSCDFSASPLFFQDDASEYGIIYNLPGASYSFQNDDGEQISYLLAGTLSKTGAGLDDTTVRLTGGNCLRMESLSSSDLLTWEQNIPTGNIQNKTMTLGVWVKINSATYYAGTHQMPRITVNYDNGTTAYAEAAQIAGSWQFLSIPITPTTTYPQMTVTISSMTDATTTNAYVYFTDFAVLYPAGYQLKLGELSYFADGEPLKPTIATNLSAADVWSVQTSGLTGTGTIGKFVTKLLTVAKFLGLK